MDVIITFYSYKGGVGRSMALVNVGEMLADVGYNVVLCDFDLEAPGLERYVSDDPESAAAMHANLGVIDLLEEYKETLARPRPPEPEQSGSLSVPEGYANVNGLILRRPSSCATLIPSLNAQRLGQLRLLGAGRRDGEWAARYSERVQHFNWSDFYARWAGAAYIDFFRSDLIAGRTVVLIDSRTGVTEHGGICTYHLADLVILLSAPNDLNIDGTKWMEKILANADVSILRQGRPLQSMPVAARVEIVSQAQELAAFRARFESEFAAAVPAAAGDGREFIQDSEIPYISYFAFTEKVVARQTDTQHRELYRAYEALAQAIVGVGLSGDLLSVPRRQDWLDERRLSQASHTLNTTLERHRMWLESEHEAGDRATLRGRDLSRQQLIGADLRNADLAESNLELADLRKANLGDANLAKAVLRGTIMRDARLVSADLRGADLTGAVLAGATLDNCCLDDARLEGATLAGAVLRFASLTRAGLTRANLADCDLRDSDLTDAVLLGADLRGADLRGATGIDAHELAQAIVDGTTRLDPAQATTSGSTARSSQSASAERPAPEILPVSAQRDFPAFADDFRFLEKEILPSFRALSQRADRLTVLRRLYMGGVLAVIGLAVAIGLAEAAVANSQSEAPGIWLVVVPSIAAAAVGSMLVAGRWQDQAAALRLKAERLRREYFIYLGRLGEYADNGTRNEFLKNEIKKIVKKEIST
jgi:uncharacterized protein YjbI with pentapeptide repeats